LSLRKTPTLTVDAIIKRDGKILLIKRMNSPFKNSWALPGGFVEYGERVEEALKREILDETGIRAEIMGIQGVYSKSERDPRGHVVSICYKAVGKGRAKGGDDALEARFFSPQEILEMDLAFDHGKILKEYLRR
jgi:8-oxo-dGTP diphosphatase